MDIREWNDHMFLGTIFLPENWMDEWWWWWFYRVMSRHCVHPDLASIVRLLLPDRYQKTKNKNNSFVDHVGQMFLINIIIIISVANKQTFEEKNEKDNIVRQSNDKKTIDNWSSFTCIYKDIRGKNWVHISKKCDQ